MKNGFKPSGPSYREEFDGSYFAVTITDGNGKDWFAFHAECPLGAFGVCRDISPEIRDQIIANLEGAISYLRRRYRSNVPAQVIPFVAAVRTEKEPPKDE
jgi:hypothetical protein